MTRKLQFQRVLNWLLSIILLTQLLWIFPQAVELNLYQPKDESAATTVSRDATVEQEMRNLKLIEATGATREWELNADQARRLKNNPEWQVSTVRIRFYGANGVVFFVSGDRAGVIQADTDAKPSAGAASPGTPSAGPPQSANSDKAGSQMWIRGNVRTVSSNGYRFRGESINYNQAEKRLWSTTPVEMESPPEKDGTVLELKGNTMSALLTTNEMRVDGNVVGVRKSPDGKLFDLRSDHAQFSGLSRSARFFERVVLKYMKMQVAGPEARFIFSNTEDQLESIFVTGGVKLSDVNRSSTSGSLRVSLADDRLVLQGSPRVVQGEDELVGDEIVFLNGGKQVQVINAKAQFSSEQDPALQPKRDR